MRNVQEVFGHLEGIIDTKYGEIHVTVWSNKSVVLMSENKEHPLTINGVDYTCRAELSKDYEDAWWRIKGTIYLARLDAYRNGKYLPDPTSAAVKGAKEEILRAWVKNHTPENLRRAEILSAKRKLKDAEAELANICKEHIKAGEAFEKAQNYLVELETQV
ncbi:MAG: hypothetical protein DWQ19_12845 [Crenarchaeota archaeon]|nr:MAG: hypothetical protein DWQ19_12845 [Thermoproteota archaeon]